MDRALQHVGLTDMAGLTIQHVVRNKQRFVRKLRILTRNDFWDVSHWLAGAYAPSSDHLDQHKKPVLIRDHKMKWLDFGTTPDEGNLSPYPGFVCMKAGDSESIEWRKVRLTKQQNVNLTADGLWAMPLNSGWVPVKTCTFSEMAFCHRFRKTYTYPPPPTERNFGAWDRKLRNP